MIEGEQYDIDNSSYKVGEVIDNEYEVLQILGSNGCGLVTYLVKILKGKHKGFTTEIQRENIDEIEKEISSVFKERQELQSKIRGYNYEE